MQEGSEMSGVNLFNYRLSLFDKICSLDELQSAFKSVKRNGGAPGPDGITVEIFEKQLSQELSQLKNDLESWTYKPKPVRQIEIPKPNGGIRLLGIPTVRDRVLHTAIKSTLEPIFDPEFSNNSYGFRPGRNQRQAVEAAQKIVQSGKEFVVDIDLSKFFDRIQHDRLISRLGMKIEDKRVLRLIGEILRSGIMKDGLISPTTEGSVQGSPLSPLLSNVVLDELDKELERKGLEFCRFADDCNIFVKSQMAAERVMTSTTKFIEQKLKLVVNQEKSKVAQSKFVKFLGMTIIAATIAISSKSMQRAMDRVKELTPRGTSVALRATMTRINLWYVGWANYHSMTQYPSQLAQIEAHIRRRLRSRIVGQQKRKRHLALRLLARGVSLRQVNRTVYTNRDRWFLSRTKALEIGYPNSWFINTLGQKIMSDQKLAHWFAVRRWIKIT
jgi:RNA-directed DNA polymerase